MHSRLRVALVVVVLVTSAGCSGLPGPSLIPGDGEPTTGQSMTPQSTQQPAADSYNAEAVDTSRILLSLADLPTGYVFSGRTKQSAGSDSNTSRALQQQGIQAIHERGFVNNGSAEGPTIIITSVTIYANESVATQARNGFLASVSGNGSDRSNVTFASGVTATRVQFTNARGYKSVLYSFQRDNLTYYVVTAGESQYHVEMTRELALKMVTDVPSPGESS